MAEKLELSAILKLNANEFINGANQAQKKLGDLGASAEKSNAQLKTAVPDDIGKAVDPKSTTSKMSDLNKELDKSNQSADDTASGLKGLGGALTELVAPLAGMVSGVAAVGFAMESLTAAGDDERWELGLREQIAFTGNAAKLTVEQMKALTEQVTSNTFATEESAQKSVSVMASFMSVQDQNFTRAIYLAQDLAEVLGSDMSGAAMYWVV